ncbi:homeobox-leucine zipper family protein [Actinidia rufa]|uniref:Homeobox-leucine zipper family protein n=1 Tax=Actinidia rufa TaxID=165716 RepID=A0A7J0H7I1_9ERIC|nr:homeobox-leucine zipper family protein [Actinidia rufa]
MGFCCSRACRGHALITFVLKFDDLFSLLSLRRKHRESPVAPNVPPAVLIRLLREHRSEWADFNIDAYSAAAPKASSFAYPGMRPMRFTGNPIIMPLSYTITHEEMLKVIRLEGHSPAQEDALCLGTFISCRYVAELMRKPWEPAPNLCFAPIDEMFPDDVPLLPSGFRISPLDTKLVELNVLHLDLLQFGKLIPQFVQPMFKWREIHLDPSPALWNPISLKCDTQDTLTIHRTLDLTSSPEVGPATNSASGDASSSYNARSRDFFCAKGCDGHISITIDPTVGLKLSPGFPEALTPVHWICQSYRHVALLFLLVFIPYLRVADSLVSLLNNGADREPEILEQIFTSWSYIMMYMQKYLVRYVIHVLSVGSFNTQACKGKEWKNVLQEWLTLLKVMRNPKSFYRVNFLRKFCNIVGRAVELSVIEKDSSFRHETGGGVENQITVWIGLLQEMMLKLPKVPSLKSLEVLCSEDAEQDFFNNIIHLQKHRRAWALSRFRNFVSSGNLSEISSFQISSIVYQTSLKSHLDSVRSEARAALAACLKELGLEYLQFICLVNPISGKLDCCLEELLSVVENDILGHVSVEKEVEKFASKMKETRKLNSSAEASNPKSEIEVGIYVKQHSCRYSVESIYLITVFALGLMHNSIKNTKLHKKDELLLSMLDPFVRLLSECLTSMDEDVISAAVMCLAPLMRLPLPSLESEADMAKTFLLVITQGSINTSSPLMQSCLTLLTVLLRNTRITLSSDQLHMAIVNRKQVHEIYDLVSRVAELMVTTSLDVLLSNLRHGYEHSMGRETVLEMLHATVVKFPKAIVDEHS